MTGLEVAAWITAAATGLTACATAVILWRNRSSTAIRFYRLFKGSKDSDDPHHWVQVYITDAVVASHELKGKVVELTSSTVTLATLYGNMLIAMPQVVVAFKCEALPVPPDDWEPILDLDESTVLRYRLRRFVYDAWFHLRSSRTKVPRNSSAN